MKKMKLWYIWVGLVVGILIYLIIGMAVPFVVQKKFQLDESIETTMQHYYGDDVGVDRARIVETSTDALEQRIRMIERAKKEIILSTFDMRLGKSSDDVVAALMAAADRGVEVKVLVDGFSGFLRMNGRTFFQALASYPNIEVKIYNKINLLTPWKLNGRMHDKYLIIDNESVLLGGRNNFDYFLGEYTLKNRSYDREVLVFNTKHNVIDNKESSIFQVKEYFEQVWNDKETEYFTLNEKLAKRKRIKKEVLRLSERYQWLQETYPEWFDLNYSFEEHTFPTNKVTLISGPIHVYGKEPVVFEELQNLMLTAKQRVEFHTPYAVLGDDMYEGIEEIANKVADFSMVINSVENGDNLFASSDYLRNKGKILDTGIKIYEFDGGDSTHGKSILIDDRISVVGSYNLDLRSTYMDTELMLVIDSKEVNASLDQYLKMFRDKSRFVLNETEYDSPEGLEVESPSFFTKMLWKIIGVLLQPFRFVI